MSKAYWQAKVWGLLHDPPLKALSSSRDFGREGNWQILRCMEGWRSPKKITAGGEFNRDWLKHIGLCDLIASASDRSTIGRLPPRYSALTYDEEGLEIRHLLSGESQSLQLSTWHQELTTTSSAQRREFLQKKEGDLLEAVKDWDDPKKVYWWLYRCYTETLAQEEPLVHILPAETRIPDASLFAHVTMTSALAGSLAGYYKDENSYPKSGESPKNNPSRPYIVTFSFSPVQELIKASRKMRDFWAGSWLLHYLSAKVAWRIALKYGPDTLLYPCLYQQPLIDHWLLQEYPDFSPWIKPPSSDQLLTAGFPNVLVLILPNNGKGNDTNKDNPVYAAMQYAKDTIITEWRALSEKVLERLHHDDSRWQEIKKENETWELWLNAQWQTYWTALPIGETQANLAQSPRQEEAYKQWIELENNFASPKERLFTDNETEFLQAVFGITNPKETEPESREKTNKWRFRQPNMNVGSWWPSVFDQLRYNLSALKNARTWLLPTAFGPRSTVSGLGPVVHPIYDSKKSGWATEGETRNFWAKPKALFDGIEELNATEVVKRGLHLIIPEILQLQEFGYKMADTSNTEQSEPEETEHRKIPILYPDLSSGVAGWLRQAEAQGKNDIIKYYREACSEICKTFNWAEKKVRRDPWGIPWINHKHPNWANPRLLNSGWLIDDFPLSNSNTDTAKKAKQEELQKVGDKIAEFFKVGNNPTDWYVIAAGDGDSMGEWLKGGKLEHYHHYIPDKLKTRINGLREKFQEDEQALATLTALEGFLDAQKRMGPATHSALSRALLDFSNQLVPYLTQERYAGRLIYGGGDDVLAYSNLWEWDSWLWDIRQCFCGQTDPQQEFSNGGDYWQWSDGDNIPSGISNRPLFTMGKKATISFGVVIAHHSVPLAIALENLWEAEEEAKGHNYVNEGKNQAKDAVQVRVLYGTGNVLKATGKFEVLDYWRQLIALKDDMSEIDSAIFEQAAQIFEQHPAPVEAIDIWTKGFSTRRYALQGDEEQKFQRGLSLFLQHLLSTTTMDEQVQEVRNWLKLAAFMCRNREIKISSL